MTSNNTSCVGWLTSTMPPKKKAAAVEVSDKELLQTAQAELIALRRLLEVKTYEAVEARTTERSWRERAEAAEATLEQAKADMSDIKADMARQHASLQEHSTHQASVLEARMSELQGQLAAAQQTSDTAAAQCKQLVHEKEQQAVAHQQEIQRLHQQFAALLQDTLSSMRGRLEEEYGAGVCGAS